MLSTCVKAAVSKQPAVAALRTITTSSSSISCRTSRAVGSKCRFLTTKTPQKPPPPPTAAASSNLSRKNPSPNTTTGSGSGSINVNPNDMSNPPDVTLEVTPEMKMANLALAAVLVGFVTGVWYYSMSSVGSQDQGGDDPLAQLKMEAQEAMDRQEKENAPDQRAQQLLREFSRGEHDPDRAETDALEELERLEGEEAAEKKKKGSWYKFW